MSGGTVRVKVAVIVTPDGKWYAVGSSDPMSGFRRPRAWGDARFAGAPLHYIEADVPLPTPTTIEGSVTQ